MIEYHKYAKQAETKKQSKVKQMNKKKRIEINHCKNCESKSLKKLTSLADSPQQTPILPSNGDRYYLPEMKKILKWLFAALAKRPNWII